MRSLSCAFLGVFFGLSRAAATTAARPARDAGEQDGSDGPRDGRVEEGDLSMPPIGDGDGDGGGAAPMDAGDDSSVMDAALDADTLDGTVLGLNAARLFCLSR